jgi:superoxide reductase
MNVFICQVCGHIEFNAAPDNCPVCYSPKEKFQQNDNIFKESQEKSPEAESKHIPKVVVESECGLIPEEGCKDVFVRIGETLHPSKPEHYIQFVDAYQDEQYIGRSYITPELNPATCFHLKKDSGKLTIVENCNIHGYWMKEINL